MKSIASVQLDEGKLLQCKICHCHSFGRTMPTSSTFTSWTTLVDSELKTTQDPKESPESESEIVTEERNVQPQNVASMELEFQDFLDLQTRLVLLPCIEDEGVGAMIASFAETCAVGATLIAVRGVSSEDWRFKDFTDILSEIREAPTPIGLMFERAIEESALEEPSLDKEEPALEAQSRIENEQPDDEPDQSALARLSSWGTLVRVKAQIAASAVATAATEVKERRAIQPQPAVEQHSQLSICALFIQISYDKFEPLHSTPFKLTTSSVVSVRQSATQGCPTKGYLFQWFRSEQDLEWMQLHGATFATYQPNTTDIGHRLKCIVTIGHEEETENIVSCVMRDCIHADMSLFNGARTALLRGAHFSNLLGRGNAEGRVFRIQIEISIIDKTVSSACIISQVSGSTSEPLHAQPIMHTSAISDPCHPKHFELSFPNGLPDSAGMVMALASQDGRLQLEAPNRLTRETLLLTLGIANFNGRPADLTTSTVLFGSQKHQVAGASLHPTTPARYINEPAEFLTSIEEDNSQESEQSSSSDDHSRALELKLQHLSAKMIRKDKVISDLQRQLTNAESQVQISEKSLELSQLELKSSRDESLELKSTVKQLQSRYETTEATMRRIQNDHKIHTTSLESRIMSQAERIADLEKNQRSLQNEKAVLTAGIDARDSKLVRMTQLQATVDSLSNSNNELKDLHQRHRDLAASLKKAVAGEKETRRALDATEAVIHDLNIKLEKEKNNTAVMKADFDNAQNNKQALTSERNNYKQKAESLSKEISRLCRKGRSLQDVQKVLENEESRIVEVEILKSQKKKALEELTEYRIAYQQSLVSQLKSRDMNGSAMKAIEKTSELERVVLELTEYVNAKEMQLETIMQVNQALTEEVISLAKANMAKNDI